MHFTPEQQAIFESRGSIKINAVAGSGKTTTLLEYASRQTGKRILYLAFNKSVEIEAAAKLRSLGLSHVEVKTAHALAYRAIVFRHGYKIAERGYRPQDLAALLNLPTLPGILNGPLILASHTLRFASLFCNQTPAKVEELDYPATLADPLSRSLALSRLEEITYHTRLFLKKMNDGAIPITHDFYLKKYQLSRPALPYDIIFFDEAQDASPVMLDLVLSQTADKVIVGDRHQQIYGWRHAKNALEEVDFPLLPLSVSFRLHEKTARLALKVLKLKKLLLPQMPLPALIGAGHHETIQSKAVLARSNLALLKRAMALVRDLKDLSGIYFEGNLASYTYAQGTSLFDVLYLYLEQPDKVKNPLFQSFPDFEALEQYAKETDDQELSMLIDIVYEYEGELFHLMRLLREKHVADQDKGKADMIFSTVHRAKGMEYDEVSLESDFIREEQIAKELEKAREGKKVLFDSESLLEEINLLYVAVTRTKSRLYLPEKLALSLDEPAHLSFGKTPPPSKKTKKQEDLSWVDTFNRDMEAFHAKRKKQNN